MNIRVREYLIEVARKHDEFVCYSDLVKDCELGFNLSTKYGQKQLSDTLGEVSEYEDNFGRPLISSLAIYKSERKNDHGDGFYMLAETLGKGKFKELRDDLYAFTQANECRKFWQNEKKFIKYYSITKKSFKIDPIKQLFNQIILSGTYDWLEDWKNDCLGFVTDVASLKDAIQLTPILDIDNNLFYQNLSKKSVRSYTGFMKKWLKERSNGIASRGQSILSEVNFNKVINDNTFKSIAKNVILNPNSNNYDLITNWWFNNNSIGNNPLLINRAIAACCPEKVTTTVHNQNFWKVIEYLKSNSDFKFNQNPYGNWYKANVQLTTWLDDKLENELKSITENKLEQNIWRNIFVWMLFEDFDSLPTIKPNSLTKREKPKDGCDEIPKRKNQFQPIDIDHQAKAKEQKDWGDCGEELVKDLEIEYLKSINKIEKAEKVEIMKDGVGYDVLSFDKNGNEKYIEVKTTPGNHHTPFYLSDNEYEFLKKNINQYSIYRIYNFNESLNSGEYFEIKGDVENQLLMKPVNYKVYLKGE